MEVPTTNATEVPWVNATEVPKPNACSANQFFDKEDNCRDLNECGSNADCQDGERNVCKEQDGKRTCVEQKECFSKCSKSEFCDSKQRCVGSPPCNSNTDCSNNTTCVSHGTTGLKSCQPESVEIAKMDECLTTVDCPARDKNRTICKEDSGRKTCVRPEQCLSTCAGKEVCTDDHKCVVPHPCKSNNDCRAGQVCWWPIKVGGKGATSPHHGPGIGQGTCRSGEDGSTVDLVLDQCVSTKDCEKTQKMRKVCKTDGKRKSCVYPDECLASCSSKEVCDSKHKCKPVNTCEEHNECGIGKVCLESPTGQKSCQPIFLSPTEQCGSNLDCQRMGGMESVCKEESGKRTCVRPGRCYAKCQPNELCDSRHR